MALTLSSVMAGGDEWMTDFAAAKEKAAKEDKKMLVDFTGSDWCGWCIRLNKEVFVHEEFKKGVADKFVLVEIDFPKDKSNISEATQKQNSELKNLYSVRGYPTILLLDAEGRPFAQTGYQKGGPENYVTHLDGLLEKGDAIQAALDAGAKLEGLEKARAYVTAINLVPEGQQIHYSDIIDQISPLDPEDSTGFLARKETAKKIKGLNDEVNALYRNKKLSEAPAVIEKFMMDNKLDAAHKAAVENLKMLVDKELAK